jgi:hypothetical protein
MSADDAIQGEDANLCPIAHDNRASGRRGGESDLYSYVSPSAEWNSDV